ncbi:PAB-dependent poly(A)-specific ribonuclease subunit PAN2 [Phanerochaete sordida]|uniref:PAN2-PAN3 deadenylation complex catalytic subunit PAN2 n=1 Tax=Phanerochaete sordida TaxID=48140 RepID=A0A9P3G2N5_9APHY|nr:PAB-dependent poly(A)-specific ribonuclease subunit PAN2 [Phanerochaete sordida]
MTATYHPIAPITHQRDIFPQPITALCFDPVSDTLWSGNNSGRIVAYYGAQGSSGVTFPVGGDLAVKGLVAGDSLVRATGVSSNGIGAWAKGGANRWFFRSTSSITAFSNNSPVGSVFFACTAAQELISLNSQTGDVVRRSPAISIYTHLANSSSTLLSGGSDGYVRGHDPRTGSSSVGAVQAHTHGIQGLVATGTFFYTIGLGLRQGRPFPDPLVKVYDTRNMKPLPPVPFSAGPGFIDLLPKRSATIVITSSRGLVNIVDVSNVTNTEFYQLDTQTYVTSTAVSPTGTYMAFGDADGAISLLTAADEDAILPLNGFEGQPIEWADPPDPLPDIDWNDSTPLNVIGMPHYTSLLLSSWTSKFLPTVKQSTVAPLPAKIPSQILSSMKTNDNVAYAALPKELRGRRNVVYSQPKSKARFRSGKGRGEVEPETPTQDYDPDDIPRWYRKVEIEYSKFGVEDFDFGFYNKTDHSGLETHITNSYTNALVQLLHHTLPIRKLANAHIATDCPREHCLFCELGFLVKMLDDAKGTNCQSTNFCKTVEVLAQTNNLIELMDYGIENPDHNYAHMIQSCHRFLMDTMAVEWNEYPNNPRLLPIGHGGLSDQTEPPLPFITQLCGVDAKNVTTCTNCGAAREKENMVHVVDLTYPKKAPPHDPANGSDLVSIIRSSLLRHSTHKATCFSCNRPFVTFESRRSIASRDLPPVLALNAGVFSEETLRYWKDGRTRDAQGQSQVQHFLQPTIELRGQVNGVDDPTAVTYRLRGMVVRVVTKEERSHLVAVVRLPDEELERWEKDQPWYLFNDFSVRSLSEDDALSFQGNWKVPTVLYYERVDAVQRLDFSSLPMELDPSILCQDTNITLNRDPASIKHELLAPEELPRPGTLVAIDAEFVSMQQEETEYRSDGTKKVLRPARLSLARVSVLRGDGPKEGVPFIDDHIHTSEVIVDYLTEFSGIKFGDLDPHMSRYTLTPLKVVYKKLRLLVDKGCVFIGHGLSKDFRIINIFVPPDQVIDTVDLYFIRARQRRLSLRFLAWFVLKENIQTETHDSIEDALSALRLYKTYIEMEDEGSFDEKLEELYREGKQYNYRPPVQPGIVAAQAASASAGPSSGTATPHTGMLMSPFAGQAPVQVSQNLLQSAFMTGQFNSMAMPLSPGMQAPPTFFSASAPRGGGGGSANQRNWRSR